MASNVSVDSKAIKGGMMITKMSMEKLTGLSKRILQDYQNIGSGGWRDQKYKDLGVLVEQSVNALRKPLEELAECEENLRRLLKEVEEYEKTKI